jgi:hypothetical protein
MEILRLTKLDFAKLDNTVIKICHFKKKICEAIEKAEFVVFSDNDIDYVLKCRWDRNFAVNMYPDLFNNKIFLYEVHEESSVAVRYS